MAGSSDAAVINDSVGTIYVKFDPDMNLTEAQEQMESLLRQRRRMKADAEDDFNVRNLSEFLRARTSALTTMGWLLGATSAISLIVGGIGIMNIMLVSVTERTREIGLRMAVGGRRRDILLQFLVEAVTLYARRRRRCDWSGDGNRRGVSANGRSCRARRDLMALAAAASEPRIRLLPARRAARLNPIDALRREWLRPTAGRLSPLPCWQAGERSGCMGPRSARTSSALNASIVAGSAVGDSLVEHLLDLLDRTTIVDRQLTCRRSSAGLPSAVSIAMAICAPSSAAVRARCRRTHRSRRFADGRLKSLVDASAAPGRHDR